MIRYRELCADEIDRELFRHFVRRQVVTKCWRRENGTWLVRDAPFVDDWSEADYQVLTDCLKNTVSEGGFVYAAFYDGRLKGMVSVEPEIFGGEQRYLDLSSIHVSEDMRGQGIGKTLFLAAKEWAKKRGGRKLYISAHSAVESQAFYKAMGCTEAQEYEKKHVEAEPYDCQLECCLNPEYEKCMAGEIYDCHNGIFLEFKAETRALLAEYHALKYEEKEKKREILSRMFGGIGKNVSVGQPFLCDYGRNIYIGNNVSVNMNCTFVDCNKITIGNNVLISSNVQLYTSTHPVELSERLTEDWNEESGAYFCTTYAKPIRIGDGAWLGGGVIVLPGVTIGEGSVIGAGSVVTRSVPANVVAAGNPCRVIRKINQDR